MRLGLPVAEVRRWICFTPSSSSVDPESTANSREEAVFLIISLPIPERRDTLELSSSLLSTSTFAEPKSRDEADFFIKCGACSRLPPYEPGLDRRESVERLLLPRELWDVLECLKPFSSSAGLSCRDDPERLIGAGDIKLS